MGPTCTGQNTPFRFGTRPSQSSNDHLRAVFYLKQCQVMGNNINAEWMLCGSP
jgi:hypothetical protein